MSFFIDWLSVEQDFGFLIPLEKVKKLFSFGMLGVNLDTGEAQESLYFGTYKHRGSYCDVINIKIRGSVVKIEGNPSRWGRVENLIGFSTIDECIECYNQILTSLELPLFTRCTFVSYSQAKENEKSVKITDGAIIKRVDITTNLMVGQGNEKTFLRALSQNRYRNSIGRLHSDCCTVDWLSAKGNALLIYPSVYIKHIEMKLHSEKKLFNKLGFSKDFVYFLKVVDYCERNGVVRFEQKLKSRFLKAKNCCYWGVSDFNGLFSKTQKDFLDMIKKLRVSKIDIVSIIDDLLDVGAVKSVREANTSAMYAMKWASGADIGLKERQFKKHRAILRKIGIDIATPCDVSKFNAVRVVSCSDILVKPFVAPDFYKYPSNINLKKIA